MSTTFSSFRLGLLLMWLPLVPATVQAQAGSRFAGLGVGISSYDLSGTGTEMALEAGVGFRLAGSLFVVPGVTYFRYSPQAGDDVTYLFPEVSLQFQAQLGALRPYLGVGAGRAFQISGPEPRFHTWTLHGTGGLRFMLSPGWGLGSEVRVRSVDPFHGVTADITAGLIRWF